MFYTPIKQSERAQGPIYVIKKNKTAFQFQISINIIIQSDIGHGICSLKYICSRDNFLLGGWEYSGSDQPLSVSRRR